ncbi:YihY/virulence factor BrkB family protein [Sulfobacillus harzensis]|uniref:YihY/virulence factor BrkB family protein n=1 Tax=Sulfobacillus harzensis TaxID=2729629 RepID=A0A7Y0L7F2_9FIRM|nr:YihY/virulence factor BrkB family protein [Sulfobacillus harzensis]NMP24704.1 YihY/virulence factor BrkB family protein [Sulfobacillus harzensis]
MDAQKAVGFARAVINHLVRRRATVYAAALSYSFIFALFPLLLFAAALSGFLDAGNHTTLFRGPAAHLVAPALRRLILGAMGSASRFKSPTLLSAGAIGFVGAMSSALRQLMNALNEAYGIQRSRRGVVVTLALSVGLGLLLGILVVLAQMVTVAGSTLVRWILTQAGQGSVPSALASGVPWVLFLLMLWFVLTLVYNWLPESSRPFHWFLPGTLTALGLWVLMSWGFSIYVGHFAHYDRTYGSLGGVILLLLYLYLVSLTLLLGGIVNAVAEARGPVIPIDPTHREM